MNRAVPADRLVEIPNDQTGLTSAQVTTQRSHYGNNSIVTEARSDWVKIVRNTIQDPMIWFLAGTALLFLWLGDYTEAGVLIAAMLPIVGMDAYLHQRTQASTKGLLTRLASQALVIRDDSEQLIPADELVPGDLVIIRAGDYIPADGLVVSGTSPQVDESSLTGEALPVRKSPLPFPLVESVTTKTDDENWGLAGTRLLTGTARIRIIFTGAETFYGEIVRLSRLSQDDRTPLQEAISRLVRLLLFAALVFCALLAGIRYAQGHGIVDAILSAVTLAIAALPEEFPVVLTFFLGLGVFRLAQRQALVRRSVVVENIGRVSCICTDKTGTLTEGELTLDHVIPDEEVSPEDVLRIGATASRTETADPLDTIILKQGRALDGDVVQVFPFTEDRLREVSVLRLAPDRFKIAMKGAPETVVSMSALDEAQRRCWKTQIDDLASSGHKVIGVAFQEADQWDGKEPEDGFRFVGLLAFSDPVRPGVADAVQVAQNAGIRVIMITGDHSQTAKAIAREIGIGRAEPRVIEGHDLEATLGDEAAANDFDVVSRCTPSQKLLLVQALRRRGELVAVTGDGVNDAPALRGADIGIAMGVRGTQSAREVASIVLLDDNFTTIVRAISEGRQLFANLKSSFSYLLMLHLPFVLTAALIPLLGYPLLYMPIHIVWIELIIHPTAMLVFQDQASISALKPSDHAGHLRFFSPVEWISISAVGLTATILIMIGYLSGLGTELETPHARAIAMASLIAASSAITAAITRLQSRSAWIATVAPVLSALLVIQLSPLANLLDLSPLHLADWGIACLTGLLVFTGTRLGIARRN